jgi:hypothetical protein
MTKETVYPSQINTKTISCRISAVDYVNFLQDALSKGITLNDWLLMKIYSQNENKNNLIGNQNGSGDTLNFPFTLEINSETYTFRDIEDIEDFISVQNGKIEHLQEWRDNLKQKIVELTEANKLTNENNFIQNLLNIDLNIKEYRTIIFSKFMDIIEETEWESSQDKKDMKRNLRELFTTLFD